MGWGSAGTLAVEDAEAIEREVPGVIGVSPEVRSGGQVSYGNMNWQTSVNGVSPDYLNIRQWKLQDGSMFTEADVRSAAKVDADLLAHDEAVHAVHRQVGRAGGKIQPRPGRDIDEYLRRRRSGGSDTLGNAALAADDDLRTGHEAGGAAQIDGSGSAAGAARPEFARASR